MKHYIISFLLLSLSACQQANHIQSQKSYCEQLKHAILKEQSTQLTKVQQTQHQHLRNIKLYQENQCQQHLNEI